MKKFYSQRDPRWERLTLGKTHYTIRQWGCTVTSLCNAIASPDFTPAEAVSKFKFNNLGEVYWSSVPGFVLRGYTRVSHDQATQYTNASDKALLVRLTQSPRHWVLVHEWTAKWVPWFLAVDPYTYNPKTGSAWIVRKMKWNIDGYVLMKPTASALK